MPDNSQTREQVSQVVRKAIALEFCLRPDEVKESTRIKEDLAPESIEALSFAFRLEREYPFLKQHILKIGEDIYGKYMGPVKGWQYSKDRIETVGQLVDRILIYLQD